MSIDFIPSGRYGEDNFDIPRHQAAYDIICAKGAETNPAVALRAQQIHGISYAEYGYFRSDALEEDGSLPLELDGTREKPGQAIDISYLLAVPRGRGIDDADATLRIGDGSVEGTPTYKYFRDRRSSGVCEQLCELQELYGLGSIREVMALASVGKNGSKGAYELMRAVAQNCIVKHDATGQRELYLMALTGNSLGPVLKFAGPSASMVIGDSVRIFDDDQRAASDLRVTPVIIDPTKMIDGVIDEIEACGDNEETFRKRQLLIGKLSFLADGLTHAQMGDRAVMYLGSHEAA